MARETTKKKVQDIHFEPKNTSLDQPKEGEHDDKEHSGGNKWAGGVSSQI
jgi:von Willebrand factor A domain-containing protein 8